MLYNAQNQRQNDSGGKGIACRVAYLPLIESNLEIPTYPQYSFIQGGDGGAGVPNGLPSVVPAWVLYFMNGCTAGTR